MAYFARALLLAAVLATACGDDDPASGPDAGVPADDAAPATPDASPGGVPSTYGWDSRFVQGESAVSYSGQSFRQTLITELTGYLGGLTAAVDTTPPADGDVEAALLFYFDFDATTGGEVPLTITTDPPLAQSTYNDISSGGANLRSKLAGNDASTDHKEWNTPGNFLGWSEGGESTDTPTELVLYWFGLIDDAAYQRGLGSVPLDPDGDPIAKVFLTAQGQDLQQLLQKFLTMAVTFSQGTDDYLDDATDGKGLLTSNLQDGDSPYSSLEHQWDEGFGYFGAARDYNDYTDAEIASPSYADSNSDNAIDLKSEYNFAGSTNCAKRDAGSDASAPTDFTRTAFDAFLAGRHLIWSTDGELSATQLDELRGHRDTIVDTWEKCFAATAVHYINDVLADMDEFGTDGYSFADHAKHWSELKGFSLGLQFNPRSPMLEGTRFADFHALIGDAPVLPTATANDIADYRADLLAARDLLKTAYGFADANVEGW